MKSKPELVFLLSVDTEEEWDWDGPFPESDFSIQNLKKIPALQSFCEGLGIRPCYFVDYAAALGAIEKKVFVQAIENNACEIGAHLHPWANPPMFDKPNEENSHVVNIPIEQVTAKLDELVSVFVEKLNYQPTSFRTGRWGISPDIMKLLWTRGFTVDSSVYPYYKNEYFTCQGAPIGAYWPDTKDVLQAGGQRNIMEIQASVGYNRGNFALADSVHRFADTSPFKYLKLVSLLWHSSLLRKIYMSPEVMEANDMIALTHQLYNNGCSYVHMFFHSSNLICNGTGFFNSDDPYNDICERIKTVVDTLSEDFSIKFMTLREAEVYFSQNPAMLNEK